MNERLSRHRGPRAMRSTLLGIIAACSAAYLLLVAGPIEELERARVQEFDLKSTFEYKQRKLVNLEALKNQMREMSQIDDPLHSLLPMSFDPDAEKATIVNGVVGLGIELERLDFEPEASYGEFVAATPFNLVASGSFEGLYHWIYGMFYASGKAVGLRDFMLQRMGSDNRLTLELQGLVFRLLPDEEL